MTVANKKPKIRTETVGVRLPPKLRYGLVLVARKNGLTLSEAMMRALEAYLENDGIAAKQKDQGLMLSMLDKLWSESPAQRLLLLTEQAPEMATRDEQCFARMMRESGMVNGVEADNFLLAIEKHKAHAFDGQHVLSRVMHEELALVFFGMFPALEDKFGDSNKFLDWMIEEFNK